MLTTTEYSPALCWTLSLWTFALGATIGSFMNVVAYRLPAGLSIVRPGSFCPHCKHPIRWWHNLPIIGWFLLRGKCYDCSAPISPRYPLVEALVAGLFLLLFHVEVLSGGANLPWLLTTSGPASHELLWTVYGYHLLLCCTLVCTALVEFDGQRTPVTLWLPPLLLGLVAPLFWPALVQVPFSWPFAGSSASGAVLMAAISGLGGVLLAIMLAWPTSILARLPAPTAAAMCASLPIVGAFLGWQAVLVLANAATLVYLITTILERAWWSGFRRVPWSGLLAAFTVALIVFWKPLVDVVAAPK
jgi:leader peptidase (prepilin peptidase) / N-methyltransferase